MNRFDALQRAPCGSERAIAFRQPHSFLHPAVILFNGLITNDKFCFIRRSPLKLEWRRRRRAASSQANIVADYLREERTLSGGDYEAQLASSPSMLSGGGCGAAVGSGLPASPGMDGVERAGFRNTASAVLSRRRRSQA
jgi:hypothetical protein